MRRKEAEGGAWEGDAGRGENPGKGQEVGDSRQAMSRSLQAAPQPGGLRAARPNAGKKGQQPLRWLCPGALKVYRQTVIVGGLHVPFRHNSSVVQGCGLGSHTGHPGQGRVQSCTGGMASDSLTGVGRLVPGRWDAH